MTEETSIACSLSGGELQDRIAAIDAIGADSLIRSGTDGARHLLHFHSDSVTRRRLEEIVAAEAECCSFLDLQLSEQDGELILTIAAPRNGQPVADELAEAFANRLRGPGHAPLERFSAIGPSASRSRGGN